MKLIINAIKLNAEISLPIPLEKWPLEIFLVCAVCCFLASAWMHTVWVRSLKTCNLTHNIDLSGIGILIFGASAGLIYYIFKCDAQLYYIYFGSQVAALVAILLSINGRMFNKDKYQWVKVLLYLFQSCVAGVALLHWRIMK